MELAKKLDSYEYDHLSSEEKQAMIDHVMENLLAQNSLAETLTGEER